MALLGAAALGACGTTVPMTVDVDRDAAASVRLGSARSYRWLEASSPSPEVDPATADVIVRSVEDALAHKGYRPQTDAPDFLVKWYVIVETKQRTTTMDSGPTFRDPRAMPTTSTPSIPVRVVRDYREGTLVLDVVDPADRIVVWRGSARADLAASSDPETRHARVREAVQRILDRFPPP